MLVFHSALASYRVDQFNLLNELFELEVVFLLDNLLYFKFDQDSLKNQCNFKISYLLKGPKIGVRYFRFGVLRKIREMKPDIVLSFEFSPTTQYLIALKKLGIIKQSLGSMVDDSLDICHTGRSKLRKITRDASARSLDFIVVFSEPVARFYQDKFGYSKQQTIVSPLLQIPDRLRAINENIENEANSYIDKYKLRNKKVLLYVGRFSPEKALPRFLESISPLLMEHDDFRFVLVGEGAEIDELMSIINKNELREKVILPGRFDGKRLLPWYLSASGLALPSRFETFGAVVDEALIFGLRVLCSEYAGATDIVNGENGIVFNPLDTSDTLNACRKFYSQMQVVGDTKLNNKPSLIADHRQNFQEEWSKLIN